MIPTRETFVVWQARLAACRAQMDPDGSYWVSELISLMDEIARGCADLNVNGNALGCKHEAEQFREAVRAGKKDRHYRTMLKRATSLKIALGMHIDHPTNFKDLAGQKTGSGS